ncbi:MAG: hypothetical protein LAO20_01405 [Acidobacteriia bacterium]|nr:hypothetical protein [Terriglobia bacterium]
MDKQLLRRLHDVKYREISELVDRKITISSTAAIAQDVAAAAQPYLPSCGKLELRSENMLAVLAKYKMLDLSFATTIPLLSQADRVSRQTLVNLGFVPSREEPAATEDADDEDPTCMTDLVQDTQAGHEWLKVFLDLWPARKAVTEFMEAVKKAQRNPVPGQDAFSVAFEQLLREVEGLFPAQFRIRDACITNSDFVWFHKHFYM